MDQPEFDIRIGKDGKRSVTVKGAKGAQCTKLADLIRDLMGKEVSRELTAEYYQEAGHVRIQVQNRGHVK